MKEYEMTKAEHLSFLKDRIEKCKKEMDAIALELESSDVSLGAFIRLSREKNLLSVDLATAITKRNNLMSGKGALGNGGGYNQYELTQ